MSGANIYVSCHNNPGKGEIRIIDKQGIKKRQLGTTEDGSFLFSTPYYITVNRSGDKVFVSDSGNVICLRMDGSIIYAFEDENMKCPRDLYCDDMDNILVCDRDSNNVQMIDAGGHKAGTFVTAEYGLKKPSSVAFRRHASELLVSCYKMNNIFVYTLTEQSDRGSYNLNIVRYEWTRNSLD